MKTWNAFIMIIIIVFHGYSFWRYDYLNSTRKFVILSLKSSTLFANFRVFVSLKLRDFPTSFRSFFLRARATDGRISCGRRRVKSRHVVWSGYSRELTISVKKGRTGLNENKIKLCQVLKLRTYPRKQSNAECAARKVARFSSFTFTRSRFNHVSFYALCFILVFLRSNRTS